MSRSRVLSSSGSQKIATASSTVAARKDRIKRTPENACAEQLMTYCAELGVVGVPRIKVSCAEPECGFQNASKVKIGAKVDSPAPQILIVVKTETNDEVNTVIIKQHPVGDGLLCALQKTFDVQRSLKVLKLEFCNLNHLQIKAVKYLLQRNRSIEDLSLNGNPNKHQNLYILLKNTALLYLSLASCQINDRGVEKIAGCLRDQDLLALNLASNYVTDDGARHVADALRSNRRLVHLNLADNFLTDRGCAHLTAALRKFPLRHDEIVIRRRRNVANLLSATEAMEGHRKSNGSDLSKSPRKSKSQTRKSSKDKMSASSGSSTKRKRPKEKEPEEAAVRLPEDLHPFVAECHAEDEAIYCRGNLKVSHLNLAYNKISAGGLRAIADTLKYQLELNEDGGLTRLILEGNDLSGCDLEVEDVIDLMNRKSNRRSSAQSSRLSSRSASRKLISMRSF